MDFFQRFQDPQLPPKDAFYSSLTEENISEIDYTHAQRVFNYFDMEDLRDYHNLYLLTDVFLLADVFKNFRDVCLQHYGLDHNVPNILVIIILSLVSLGKLLLNRRTWNWSFSLILINICSSSRHQWRSDSHQPPIHLSQCP